MYVSSKCPRHTIRVRTAYVKCAHTPRTTSQARGLGVGYAMGRHYLRFAKELGYLGSLFNLVFVNNIASIKIW